MEYEESKEPSRDLRPDNNALPTLTCGAPLLPKRGYFDAAEAEGEAAAAGAGAGAGGDAIGEGGAALLLATIWLSKEAAFRTTLCTTPMFYFWPFDEREQRLAFALGRAGFAELCSVGRRRGRGAGVGSGCVRVMNADRGWRACVCVVSVCVCAASFTPTA